MDDVRIYDRTLSGDEMRDAAIKLHHIIDRAVPCEQTQHGLFPVDLDDYGDYTDSKRGLT